MKQVAVHAGSRVLLFPRGGQERQGKAMQERNQRSGDVNPSSLKKYGAMCWIVILSSSVVALLVVVTLNILSNPQQYMAKEQEMLADAEITELLRSSNPKKRMRALFYIASKNDENMTHHLSEVAELLGDMSSVPFGERRLSVGYKAAQVVSMQSVEGYNILLEALQSDDDYRGRFAIVGLKVSLVRALELEDESVLSRLHELRDALVIARERSPLSPNHELRDLERVFKIVEKTKGVKPAW